MSDVPLPPLDPDMFTGGLPPHPDHPDHPPHPPTPTPGSAPPNGGPRNMTTTTFKITRGEFGLSLTDPGKAVADATLADYTDFSCQVVGAVIRMSPNFSNEEVPGTFCVPPQQESAPAGTTYSLDVDALADPDAVAGLAAFLWENDSGESGTPAYFYLGLAQGAAPKAIGKVWLAPMDFGGEARTVLRADVSLALDGRPSIEFGTTADA